MTIHKIPPEEQIEAMLSEYEANKIAILTSDIPSCFSTDPSLY